MTIALHCGAEGRSQTSGLPFFYLCPIYPSSSSSSHHHHHLLVDLKKARQKMRLSLISLTATFLLVTITNAWSIKHPFGKGVCAWSGCPHTIPAEREGTDQGQCIPADPTRDIKSSDPRYFLGYEYNNDNGQGWRRGFDTYRNPSPDNYYVYKASITIGGLIKLRNQPLETKRPTKAFIYLLKIQPIRNHVRQPVLTLAYWLTGEGFCTIQVDAAASDEDPFFDTEPNQSFLIWSQ